MSAIANFSEQLHGLLEKPSLVNPHRLLLIKVLDKTISVLDHNKQPNQASIIFDVEPAWELITMYFGFSSQQKNLPLGLFAINDSKHPLTHKNKL